jgi:hypothetical protein
MTAAASSVGRYEAILAHAELELELAGRGEVERLAALDGRWELLLEGLPETAPSAAAPILERARLIHERTRIELIRLREALLREVAVASTAKRTAAGYGAEGLAAPRLDRRA